MPIKHYKTRNTLLLFEILISKLIMEMKNSDSPKPSLHILKKYFSSNTELAKDLKIYEVLSENTSHIKLEDVDKYITEIIERDDVNIKVLREEHYKLGGVIQKTYNMKEFFSTDIKNYTTIASVFKLLSFYREGEVNNIENVKDRLIYENRVKEILTLPPKKKSKNADRLAKLSKFENIMLPISFKKKYNGVLTTDQMTIVWKGLGYDDIFLQEETQKLYKKLNESILGIGDELKTKVGEGLDVLQHLTFDKNQPEQFESNVKVLLHTHNLILEITKLNDISKKKLES